MAELPPYKAPTNQLGSPFNSIWDLDYFSGSQVFIYIGDTWVDEVTSLQYETRQNKVPLYGYASQLFDMTAAGQVLVQGSFTINFKEQGYLLAVLNRYMSLHGVYNQVPVTLSPSSDSPTDASSKKAPKLRDQTTYQTIERLLSGQASYDEKYSDYLNLAGSVNYDVTTPQSTAFNDLCSAFESQVWGSPNQDQGDNSERRADNNRLDDFDIYVVFGNYQTAEANHTVQKISGVRILSQSKIVQIDGRPVQEQYDFIARTVV